MPSARAQRKALDSARSKLHPTSEPLAYALAVGGPQPLRTLLLVIGAAVAAIVMLSTLLGALAGPGWLFFLSFWAFNPPRAVITTTNSAVVMGRSMFNARPTDVRAVVGVDALLQPSGATSGPWHSYRLGEEVVWMTRRQAAIAVDAARAVAAAHVA